MLSQDSSPPLLVGTEMLSRFVRLSLILSNACDKLIEFQVFVGYWPAQDTVVVAHEGTDPTQLCALHHDFLTLSTDPISY
jgi:hypothetical protein